MQGVAFIHAGDPLLRSKSLDRDSYNSGRLAPAKASQGNALAAHESMHDTPQQLGLQVSSSLCGPLSAHLSGQGGSARAGRQSPAFPSSRMGTVILQVLNSTNSIDGLAWGRLHAEEWEVSWSELNVTHSQSSMACVRCKSQVQATGPVLDLQTRTAAA